MEITIVSAFVIVFLIIFFVSKSAAQFDVILFSVIFLFLALAFIITKGLTIETVITVGGLGLLSLLGWFNVTRKLANTIMARASFDSKLTQKRYSRCNVCGKRLSHHKMPKNLNQLFFGGLTCKNCGAEFDIPFDEFISQ